MIRLRDRYISRRRGENWLLLGDALAASAAISLASGAAGAGVSLVDRLLVLLWAVLPVGLARALDPVLAAPRGAAKNIAIAAAVGATLLALILIGLELLGGGIAAGIPRELRAWWQLGIVIAWGLGFLLFLPRLYLARDLLLGGATILSLALGRPGSALLAPAALFGLLLSGAMRHQLLDVFAEIRRPRVNAHNARLLALALALGGALVYGVTYAGAVRLFAEVGLARTSRTGAAGSAAGIRGESAARATERAERDAADRGGAERDGSEDLPAGAGGVVRALESDPEDATESGLESAAESLAGASDAAESPAPSAPTAAGVPAQAGGAAEGSPEGASAQIGFSRAVRLGGLVRPQSDPRLVFAAREFDPRGFRTPLPSLSPATLWRGITLATFDASTEAWREEVLVAGTHPWPAGSLRFSGEERAPAGGPDDLLLEISVHTPVMPTLPTPYFPLRLSPPRDGSVEYRLNAAGDLFPIGGVPEGTTYAVRIAPPPRRGAPWPADPIAGPHSDPRYGEIPDAALLGFDLAAHAAPIFAGAESIQERIARLRDTFSRDFRYDIEVRFIARSGWLREFCLVERIGNCEYFATAAALLLRAGGVSTRVVAGFLGWEWSAETGEYLIRNGTAHLWVEVYFPGAGWFPLDATAWVPAAGAALDAVDPRVPRERGADAPEVGLAGRGEEPGAGARGESGGAAELAARGEAKGAGSDAPWIELLPPVGAGTAEGAPGDASAARDGGDEPRERRASRDGANRMAKGGLFAIALLLALFLLRRELRPEPEEEEDAVEDSIQPRGGIPDPLAGLPAPPASADPTDPRGRILGEYHRLQRALAERRRHRRPAETPRAHGGRIGERHPAALGDFAELHAILYAALYAPEEPAASLAEEAERVCSRLRSRLG